MLFVTAVVTTTCTAKMIKEIINDRDNFMPHVLCYILPIKQMTTDFKPSLHCASINIAAKDFQRSTRLLKGLLTLDILHFVFISYVRTILEYNSPMWNPWLLQDIRCVERVQRFFTRAIFKLVKLPTMSYADCLLRRFSLIGVLQSVFRSPYVF